MAFGVNFDVETFTVFVQNLPAEVISTHPATHLLTHNVERFCMRARFGLGQKYNFVQNSLASGITIKADQKTTRNQHHADLQYQPV
jgi:hypothetical protein